MTGAVRRRRSIGDRLAGRYAPVPCETACPDDSETAISNRMRPAARIRRSVGVGASIRVRLAVGVRLAGAVGCTLAVAVALGSGLRQHAGEQRRQADPKGDPAHAVLPGRPGGGVFRQPGEHLGDIHQADRGGEHQEEELFFQVAHPTEQDFVLLEGVLLSRRAGLDQRVVQDSAAAAARVFTRVGVTHRDQDVFHVVEAEEDPFCQADGQRFAGGSGGRRRSSRL